MKEPQPAPKDLKPRGRGRKLWRAVAMEFFLTMYETSLLHEAARCLDTLDELDVMVRKGLFLPDMRIGPWVTEARLQQLVLTRLIASLRLPDDLDGLPEARPQHRGGARGPYDRGGKT